MPQVLNYDTGKTEHLEGSAFAQALARGNYGVDPNERVSVVSPEGDFVSIPSTGAATAFEHGYTPEESGHERKRKLGAKYDNVGSEALAGLAGVGRGISGGLSDVLLTKTGAVAPETLSELKEFNPLSSGVGEALGVAGSLLAPEAAIAAKVGGLPRAIAALGRGAETMTGSALKGLGLAGDGLASLALRKTSGSAVEGALYGAGQLLSEDALGESDFTGDALVAHMGGGALIGGLGGGLLGAAPKAAMSVGEAALKRVGVALEGSTAKEKLTNFLQDFAEKRAVKATGGYKADYGRLTAKGTNTRAVNEMGRDLLDHGVVTADASVEDIANRAGVLRERQQKVVDEMAAELEKSAPLSSAVSGNTLADTAEKDVLQPLQESVRNGDAPMVVAGSEGTLVGRLKREIDQLRDLGDAPIPLDKLEQIKHGYDKYLKHGAEPIPIQAVLEDLRGVVDAHSESAEQRLAKLSSANPFTAQRLTEAKRLYGSFAEAEGMAQRRILANEANGFASSKDYAMGIAGSMLTGHALGGGAALIAGLPAAFAHKVLRERGAAISADVLNRAARLAKLERVVKDTRGEIGKSVERFLSGAKPARGFLQSLAAPTSVFEAFTAMSPESPPPDFRQALDPKAPGQRQQRSLDKFDGTMAALQSNPMLLQNQIAKSLVGVEDVAPKASIQAGETAAKMVQFLRSKMPQSKSPSMGLEMFTGKAWQPTDHELASFARYTKAAFHPMTVIEGLGHGMLTQEGVETLKALYPALYRETVRATTEQIASGKSKLDYDARLRLSSLLGVPLDPMLHPTVLRAIKQSYAPTDSQFTPQWKPSAAAQSNMKLGQSTMTKSQNLEG